MVKWYHSSFPNLRRGFDSRYPLQLPSSEDHDFIAKLLYKNINLFLTGGHFLWRGQGLRYILQTEPNLLLP